MLWAIVVEQSVYPKWHGLPLIPSDSAADEHWRYYLDLHDMLEVLERGYDCAESRRSEGVFQRCLKRKDKVIKAVVVLDYNRFLSTECWLLKHVGVVSR